MNLRANFTIVEVTDAFVALVDDDTGASVTNDATAVVAYLLSEYGTERRLIYRDSMGRWDELRHDGKRFVGFAPLTAPKSVIDR